MKDLAGFLRPYDQYCQIHMLYWSEFWSVSLWLLFHHFSHCFICIFWSSSFSEHFEEITKRFALQSLFISFVHLVKNVSGNLLDFIRFEANLWSNFITFEANNEAKLLDLKTEFSYFCRSENLLPRIFFSNSLQLFSCSLKFSAFLTVIQFADVWVFCFSVYCRYNIHDLRGFIFNPWGEVRFEQSDFWDILVQKVVKTFSLLID